MNLNIALIQSDIVWENSNANRRAYTEMLEGVSDVDLIVFPEMFTTGFSLKAKEMAELMSGPTVKWMLKLAKHFDAAICGSLIIEDKGKFYNRFIWAQPNGEVFWYDKRHLFRMGEENEVFSRGLKRIIIEWRGWRICPLICYDLRFPVFSRNKHDYDLLLYVANWPAPRDHVWRTLLPARAIENQAYCIGVNRLGTDGAGLTYTGNSLFIDPKGYTLHDAKSVSGIHKYLLNISELNNFRKSFPVGLDADNFTIEA